MMIATLCLYGLALVLESVLVKFLVLHLILKVLKRSGNAPPLYLNMHSDAVTYTV